MDYILRKEKLDHGLQLTVLQCSKNELMIIDSTDYFDDDSEWDEYYTLVCDVFPEIINRLGQNYKPVDINKLESEEAEFYNSLENDLLKIIFLYILSINEKKPSERKIEKDGLLGSDLINILCGTDIKYKQNIWSKGP